MGKGSKILMVLAIIVAFASGLGVYTYLDRQDVVVYLYNDNYPSGTTVTASMFSTYSMPQELYNAMQGTGNSYAGAAEISDHMDNGDTLLVDVAKYTTVMSNQFVSGGGTAVEMRLEEKMVSVELPADTVMGLNADLRVGSRINVATGYSVDSVKFTDLIFQNLLIVDKKVNGDGTTQSVFVEVSPEESLELLHAIAFETVQVSVVKPNSYEEVPAEKASFYRSYRADESMSMFDANSSQLVITDTTDASTEE